MKDEHPFDIWCRENADKLKEAQQDGTYSAVLKTGEISVAMQDRAFSLCLHHTRNAAEQFKLFRDIVSQDPEYEHKQREAVLYSLPQYLRDRLVPVFAQSDVFDPQCCYKERFDEWELKYSALFSLADFNPSEGYKVYIGKFYELMEEATCIIDGMLTDLKCEVCL